MNYSLSHTRVLAPFFAMLAGVGVLLGGLAPASAVAQEVGNAAGEELEEVAAAAGVVTAMPAAVATAGADGSVIPRAYSYEDRYRVIGEESPFMLDATPDQLIVESAFRDLAVSSWMEGPDGFRVRVVNMKTKQGYTVTKNPAENPLGLTVLSVENDPNPRNVKILVEGGGEQGTLTFDAGLINAPITAPAAAPQVNRAIPNSQGKKPTPSGITARSDGTQAGRRRIVLPKPIQRPVTPPAAPQGQRAPAANPPSQ